MLLTSSQVGIAISSFIVLLCTAALFLSGYALQQKTVSNLRQAIKPSPRPAHTYMVLPSKEDAVAVSDNSLDGAIIVQIESGDHKGDSEALKNVKKPQSKVQQVVAQEDPPPIARTQRDDEGGTDRVGSEGYYWTKKSKKKNNRRSFWSRKEEVPLEELTGAARRKRIKDGIVNLDDPGPEIKWKPRKTW